MMIFLYGSDSFRRARRLKNLIAEYKNQYPRAVFAGFDFEFLANETGRNEFIRFQEFMNNRSIFDNKKIAVLENIFGKIKAGKVPGRDFAKSTPARTFPSKSAGESYSAAPGGGELKKIIKANLFAEDAIIIISESSKPPADWKFLLKDPVRVEEFDELQGAKLVNFVKEEVKLMGINLTSDALNFLAGYYRGNFWGLMTELEKLRFSDFASKQESINLEMVKAVGDYPETQNIFNFMNAIQCGDARSKKLKALEEVFLSGEDLIKVFNILASRNHEPDFLQKLADYDTMIKSGRLDYEEVLLDLALS